MNICFLLGKIISEPTFDFLYKCKNISISSFCLKTRNGNIVQIFGYDEIADFLYSHLAINDDVYVEGYLTSFKNNISVNIININKIMQVFKIYCYTLN